VEQPDWTDAQFALVKPPRRFGFRSVFWWAVYACGFAWAAKLAGASGEVIVYVFGASLIVPGMRFSAEVFRALAERTSEQEALQARYRLLGRAPTIWAERAGRRGRG